MTKAKTKKWIHPKLILVVNILCILMIIWVSIQNKAFAMIFFSLLIASQCVFWWVRKLRDDKKWVGSYSTVGIIFTASAVIPLYIAFFCILNYSALEIYLNAKGWSGISDVIKISFYLKP
jgi:hypothetical protein